MSVLFFAFIFLFYSHAQALTISPARLEIAGDPGSVVGGEFSLMNEQSTTQTFYASYENFGAQGETGTPSFSSEKVGLDTWISVIPSSLTVKPGETVKIPYTITIPKQIDPGGYFSSIFWSTTPPSNGSTQVSIGAKVGILVLLRVNGNVSEKAGITMFDRNGHGFFYNTLPVDMRYKFGNQGGDRVEPQGEVTIRDTLFLPADHIDANISKGNILPGSVRQFTLSWIKQQSLLSPQGFFDIVSYQWHNFAVGLYSAHLNLSYGASGLTASRTIWFFVFTWQLLICMLLVIGIVWFGGKIFFARYNRYIISRAQNQGTHRDENKA